MTGQTRSTNSPTHIDRVVSQTRDHMLAMAKGPLFSDALRVLEDRREELYGSLSICAMVRDSLDKTKDDSERCMEQFEAMNTALAMLRKVWEGLDWMNISSTVADIDRKRMEENAAETADEA
jgi:hypothetical protein